MQARNRNLQFTKVVALDLIFTCATTLGSKAASAVAIATNPKTGKLVYSHCHSGPFNEAKVKSRVIQDCIAMGGANPKVIASTSKGAMAQLSRFKLLTTRRTIRFR